MNLNYAKYVDGLVPTIVQDAESGVILMLGFVNPEAVEATQVTGRITFFSRSKQRLWTKGETSGHYLDVVSMIADCDEDTLLIKARPVGPVCHTGSDTCFGENLMESGVLNELERVIEDRRTKPTEDSYVTKLFSKGLNKIAQKVGEEAVELVIAAKDDDTAAFKNEAADLLFHFLVLLAAKGTRLPDIIEVLKGRRSTAKFKSD